MNNHSRLLTALVATVVLLIGSAISRSAVAQTRPALQSLQDQINALNTRVNNPASPCFDDGNRYVDCGNGTVTDSVTSLIWLKNANCPTLGLNGTGTYAEANAAAANLKAGDCGLSDNSKPGDWRLPTEAEWQATIQRAVELGCQYANSPSLTNTPGTACFSNGPQPFSGVQTAVQVYWSSSSDVTDPAFAWVFYLGDGNSYTRYKSSIVFYVWPVRGEQ